jgi:hypothetical protein
MHLVWMTMRLQHAMHGCALNSVEFATIASIASGLGLCGIMMLRHTIPLQLIALSLLLLFDRGLQ